MYVCPSLCLSFSPSVCLSIVYPSIQTSIDKCHFVCPVCTWKLRHAVQTGSRVGTGWRLVTLILHLSVCLSVCPSICLSVCPSVCPSIQTTLILHLSTRLPFHPINFPSSVSFPLSVYQVQPFAHLSVHAAIP